VSFTAFWLLVLLVLGGLHQWIRRRRPHSWDEAAAHTLFWSATAVLVVRLFLVAPYMTSGPSMSPTLPSHSLVLVDKMSYGFVWPFFDMSSGTTTPQDGEVVAFIPPRELDETVWIKRVRARPGDWVNFDPIRGWFVNNNWVAPATERSPAVWAGDRSGRAWGTTASDWGRRVPPGSVFLLGDNIHNSSDSRDLGLVPVVRLLGRVVWPRQMTTLNPSALRPSTIASEVPRFRGPAISSRLASAPAEGLVATASDVSTSGSLTVVSPSAYRSTARPSP
jgi:signal peptidase I